MKYQIVDSISGKPYKVKFINQSVGYKHYSMRFCSGIKFYFDDVKITYVGYFNNLDKSKKELKQELLKHNYNFNYYKNAKVIIGGINLVDKCFKKIIRKRRFVLY